MAIILVPSSVMFVCLFTCVWTCSLRALTSATKPLEIKVSKHTQIPSWKQAKEASKYLFWSISLHCPSIQLNTNKQIKPPRTAPYEAEIRSIEPPCLFFFHSHTRVGTRGRTYYCIIQLLILFTTWFHALGRRRSGIVNTLPTPTVPIRVLIDIVFSFLSVTALLLSRRIYH